MRRFHLVMMISLLALTRVSPASAQSVREMLSEGNRLFAAGEYERALAQYEAAGDISPDSFESIYNAAVALQRLGRLDEAEERFRTIDSAPGASELASRARYNLGVANMDRARSLLESMQQDGAPSDLGEAVQDGLNTLQQASDWFRSALDLDPNDPDAARNLELARRGLYSLRQLQQQMQQQQQQDQPRQQQQDNQQQDQSEQQDPQEPQSQEQQEQQSPGQQQQQQNHQDSEQLTPSPIPDDAEPGQEHQPTPPQPEQPEESEQQDIREPSPASDQEPAIGEEQQPTGNELEQQESADSQQEQIPEQETGESAEESPTDNPLRERMQEILDRERELRDYARRLQRQLERRERPVEKDW